MSWEKRIHPFEYAMLLLCWLEKNITTIHFQGYILEYLYKFYAFKYFEENGFVVSKIKIEEKVQVHVSKVTNPHLTIIFMQVLFKIF